MHNKSQYIAWFWLLFLAVGTQSCVKELELETPDHASMLVLNSVISPDSSWAANLSKSVAVFDPNRPEFVEDAEVEIYDLATEQLVVSLTSRPLGEYDAIGPMPEIGKTYQLRASAPGFPAIEALTSIPQPAALLSVVWRDTVVWNREGNPEGLVTFTFQDDPDAQNFYFISLFRSDTAANFMDTIVFFNPVPIYSYDPTLESDLQEGALLTDLFFNGEQREVNIHYEPGEVAPDDPLWLFLGTVSADFYWYRKTQLAQVEDRFDPLADPTLLHTNVTNGLGIFAGYSLDTIRVK